MSAEYLLSSFTLNLLNAERVLPTVKTMIKISRVDSFETKVVRRSWVRPG